MKAPVAIPAIAMLLLAGCVNSPGYRNPPRHHSRIPSPAPVHVCFECGTVTAIERAPAQHNTAAGAVLGGIVGAVVGKEVGRSFSGSRGKRNVAAAAGAVGGAIVGSSIQNQMQAGSSGYLVHVRMHDGHELTVHLSDVGGLQQGTPVRVRDGQLYLD